MFGDFERHVEDEPQKIALFGSRNEISYIQCVAFLAYAAVISSTRDELCHRCVTEKTAAESRRQDTPFVRNSG